MVLPIIGPLFSTIGSAAGSALSTAGSVAGSAIQGAGSLAGEIGRLGTSLAYQAPQFAADVGGAALEGAGDIGGALYEGAGGVLDTAGGIFEGLPDLAEKMKPVTETLGGVYGAYQSYEQAKAAREAAQRYGRQVRLPVGSIPTGVQAPVQTPIPTINVSGGGGPPMTEEERLYRQAQQTGQLGEGQLLKYAIIGLGIYLIATKV